MSRLILVSLVVGLTLAMGTSEAFAQRDAGAKARGDLDSFWSPRYSHSRGLLQSSMMRQSPTRQSVQNFSYEPQENGTIAESAPTVEPTPVPSTSNSIVVRANDGGSRWGVFSRGMSGFSSRSTVATKPAWAYPKTDPRRYRH